MTTFTKKLAMVGFGAVLLALVFVLSACSLSTTMAEKIYLDNTAVTLAPQDTITLTATVEPADANDAVYWSSSNESIATVSNAGVVTAVAVGDAQITVSTVSADGYISATCNVTVALSATASYTGTVTISNIAANSFSVVPSEEPITGRTLEYSINGTDWQTSTSFTGDATSVSIVYVRYQATATQSASDAIEVVVAKEDTTVYAESLSVKSNSVSLDKSETYVIGATTVPSYITVGIDYIIADTSIVELSNGVITAVGEGTTTVTLATKSKNSVTNVLSSIQEVITVSVALSETDTFGGEVTATMNDNKITVTATGSVLGRTLEYSIDGTIWQDENVFTNVTESQYIVYTRVKATESDAPSNATLTLVGSGDITTIHSSSVSLMYNYTVTTGVRGSIASGAFVTPIDYAGELYWYSSDESIVSITDAGIITANKAGTVTIILSAISRNVNEEAIMSATCTITVTDSVQGAYNGGFDISATDTGFELSPFDSTAGGLLEYSTDGLSWTTSGAFDAVSGEQYVIYARYAATSSSPASTHVTVLASVPDENVELSISSSNDEIFVVGDDESAIRITVKTSDGRTSEYTVEDASMAGIQLLNFDTTTIGANTMTVSYMGVSATLEYTVVDFRGAGTEQDPYQIDTVEQFYSWRDYNSAEFLTPYGQAAATTDYLGKCFELTSDITVDATTDAGAYSAYYSSSCVVVAGTLNGNGHTINVISSSSSYYRVFDTVGTVDENGEAIQTTFKDINFNFTGACGITTTIMNDVTLDNVDIYGEIETSSSNYSPYVIYVGYSFGSYGGGNQTTANMLFDGCDVYANINYLGAYMGLYVGSGYFYTADCVGENKASFDFTDCHLYGDVVTTTFSFFEGNSYYCANITGISDYTYAGIMTIDNCGIGTDENGNTGTVAASGNVDFVFGSAARTDHTNIVIKNSIYDENGDVVDYDGETTIYAGDYEYSTTIQALTSSVVELDENREMILSEAELISQLGLDVYNSIETITISSYYEAYQVYIENGEYEAVNGKVTQSNVTLNVADMLGDDGISTGLYGVPVVARGDLAQLAAQWTGDAEDNPYIDPILMSDSMSSIPAVDYLYDNDGNIIAIIHRQALMNNDKLSVSDVVGDEEICVNSQQVYYSFYFYDADGARIASISNAAPASTGTYGLNADGTTTTPLEYLLSVTL